VFPSLICGILLSQDPRILVSGNVVSKRESLMFLHYKMFAGAHVPNIFVTSGQGVASSISKEDILAELKEMSKTLEETIRTSTERKINVDKMILALSAQDEEMAEENVDGAGNEEAETTGNTEDGNDNDDDGDDQDGSEADA